jgi:hypothetical protein
LIERKFAGNISEILKIGGKMKRVHVLLVTGCCLLFCGLFIGCGGGPGSPGSHGTENTGVILDVSSITPVYNGANTYSVDAVQQVCDPGPPPKIEFFADHDATVTISARLLNPNTTFTPGTLYIEKYTVEFRRSTDSIGAPPIEKIIDGTVGMPLVITPPSGQGITSFTTTVLLVDLIRKDKYLADIQSGIYNSNILNNYTALYTFKGKNQFGEEFSIEAQPAGFQIGSFNYCGG